MGKRKKLSPECEAHRLFLPTLVCAGCRGTHGLVAAHIRASVWGMIVVPDTERGGMGLKPHMKWSVPLCFWCHIPEQHQKGERAFWDEREINPLALAADLWRNRANREACLGLVHRASMGATL